MEAKRNNDFLSVHSETMRRCNDVIGIKKCDSCVFFEPRVRSTEPSFKTICEKSFNEHSHNIAVSQQLEKNGDDNKQNGFKHDFKGPSNAHESNYSNIDNIYNHDNHEKVSEILSTGSNNRSEEESQNYKVEDLNNKLKLVELNSTLKVKFTSDVSIESKDLKVNINVSSKDDGTKDTDEQYPIVRMLEDNINVLVDRELDIICELEGFHDPSVKWYHQDAMAGTTTGFTLIKEDDSRRKSLSFPDYTKLVINKTSHLDSGFYKVLVNDNTWSSPAAEVVVWDPPVTPKSSPIIKVIAQNDGEVSLDVQWDPLDKSVVGPHWYEVECVMEGDGAWRRRVSTPTAMFEGAPRGRLIKCRYRIVLPCGVSDPSPTATVIINYPSRPSPFQTQELLKMSTYDGAYTETPTVLGRGAFGKVVLIKDKMGNEFASKYTKNKAKTREVALREHSVMQRLTHDRIVKLYGGYEDANHIILVTEYLSGGELFERMVQEEVLTESDCAPYIRQICEGVAFIHHQRVVHLDLKAENVMCVDRTTNRIKIIDFGLAHVLLQEPSGLKTMYGTRDYAAPEIVNYDDITFNTDMWSVGVITYVLLSGLLPFSGDTWTEESAYISAVEYNYDDEAFENISDEAKDFIDRLLVKAPSHRMSAIEALTHTWLAAEPGKRIDKLDKTKENLKTYLAVCKQRWQMARNVLIAARRLRVNVENRRSPSANEPRGTN